MTEIEAINEIKSWTSVLISAGSECNSEIAEAQKMAIEALEKQLEIKKVLCYPILFAEKFDAICKVEKIFDN